LDIDFLFETLDALEHKEYAKALENSLETIAENPNDLEALKIAVKCLMEDGRKPAYTSVLEYTERILKQEPGNTDAKISRIKALRRLERVEAASILLDRLEKTEPNNPDVLQQKSSILIHDKRYDAAKKILERLEELEPELAFNNLGAIASFEDLPEKALNYFSLRLKDDSSNFIAARNKCWTLYTLKRYDEAISTVEKFIDEFGDTRYQMYRAKAILYLMIAKDFSDESHREFDNQPMRLGEGILEESDERWNDPKFKNTMLRTKFLKKSRKAFEEIDEKGIQNQLSKYWKAVMYCYMDEIDNALDAIEECLEEKQHWDILSWKAYALKRQEKYKEAIKVADQVLKDYPESWVIATKLDALFWSGDLLEWKRVDLKHEEKRKKEKLSNQTKLPEEISIFPGADFDNTLGFVELLSCCKKNIRWIDPFFGIHAFQYIRLALSEKIDISEIHVLMGFRRIKDKGLSLPQNLKRLEDYRDLVADFNNQYSEIDMILGINKKITDNKSDVNYHDRYLFSEDNEWNITSTDTIGKGDRGDMYRIRDPKTIDKDCKLWEDFWNSESTFKITGSGDDDYNKLRQVLEKDDVQA